MEKGDKMKKSSVFDEIFDSIMKHGKELFFSEFFDEETKRKLYQTSYKRCDRKRKKKSMTDEQFKNCLHGEIFTLMMEKQQSGHVEATPRQKDVHVDEFLREMSGLKKLRFWDEDEDEETHEERHKRILKELGFEVDE